MRRRRTRRPKSNHSLHRTIAAQGAPCTRPSTSSNRRAVRSGVPHGCVSMRRKKVSARKSGGPLAASGATKLSPHLRSPTFLKLSAAGGMCRAARAVSADVDVVRGRRSGVDTIVAIARRATLPGPTRGRDRRPGPRPSDHAQDSAQRRAGWRRPPCPPLRAPWIYSRSPRHSIEHPATQDRLSQSGELNEIRTSLLIPACRLAGVVEDIRHRYPARASRRCGSGPRSKLEPEGQTAEPAVATPQPATALAAVNAQLEQELTDHRRTEEVLAKRTAELEDARNFLDSVLENLPVMLFVKMPRT